MKRASLLLVTVCVSLGQPAEAQVRLVSDVEAKPLCERARADLRQIGIDVAETSSAGTSRRARRRAFSDTAVQALVSCQASPGRIEVFYPDGSRLGAPAFAVPAPEGDPSASVYVSERIRAERFVADVPKTVPYAPSVWWLGIGGDALLSRGGVAPLGLVTLGGGYRFHRHWSVQAFTSVQPYMKRLDAGSTETRLRVDQLGVAIAYHAVVTPRVDLAVAARAAAVRLGVSGTGAGAPVDLEAQRDQAWLVFPAGRLSLRVGLTDRFWLRMQGEVGALVPKAVVAAGTQPLASLGVFAAQLGLGLEVHFR